MLFLTFDCTHPPYTWIWLNTPIVITDAKGSYELGDYNVSATEIRTLKLLTHYVCCLDMKKYPVLFLCLNVFCVVYVLKTAEVH